MNRTYLAWRLLHSTPHHTVATVMGTCSSVNQGLMHGSITGSKATHLLSTVCLRQSSNSMRHLIQYRKRSSKGQMLAGIRSVRLIQVSKTLIPPRCIGAMPTHKRSLNTIHPISSSSSSSSCCCRVNGQVHVWLPAATTFRHMSVLLTRTLHQSSAVSKRTSSISTWDFFSPCQRKVRARIPATFVGFII